MSCDWGYRCKKDGAETETWFNHGEEILRDCVKAWPYIQKIQEVTQSYYIEVHIMGYSYADTEVWKFLHEHYEHGIELLNEYGESAPLEELEQ